MVDSHFFNAIPFNSLLDFDEVVVFGISSGVTPVEYDP